MVYIHTGENTTDGKLRTSTTVANGGIVLLSGTGDKLSVFKISSYLGDRLNNDEWIHQVESAFCLATMARFSTSKSACIKQQEW